MSDTGTEAPPAPVDPEAPGLDPNIRGALRKIPELSRAKAEAEAERDAARRELAFVKAGIPTDSGPGKLLAETFKGEPTAEAVMAHAQAYGISLTAPAPAGPIDGAQPGTPDLSAQQRITAAGAAGATPAGAIRLEDAIASANSAEELFGILERAPQEAFRVRT